MGQGCEHQHSLASPNGDTKGTFDLWAMGLISAGITNSLPVQTLLRASPAPRVQAQVSGWAGLLPCWDRGSHQPCAPASHRFSVLRNLLPGWKRCLRLLETECFLLWGWFLQASVEQRAEDDAGGDEELMPTHWEGSAEVSTA